jgi:serine/threonine protein kinase/tetratricopeptide (TPR) repeat protein
VSAELLERVQAAVGAAYIVERELGGGGMSRVFVAEERALGRRVVIKVLPPELASEVSATRFEREIRVTADLLHPHILPIHTAGAGGMLLYYVTPYVTGESLRHWLDREPRLPVDDAVRILCEVADALNYAHRRGIVHRDIKPDNILMQDGHALVADFGVATALEESAARPRLTGTGMAVGTPGYVAPEQLAGETSVDVRADIYALGVVGYEMLAGRAPFAGPSPRSVIAAQFTGTPTPLHEVRPELPAHVSDAITRALEREPEARFQTAAEFRDALMSQPLSMSSQLPAPRATPPSWSRLAWTTRSRWRSNAALAVLAAAALVVAVWGVFVLGGSFRTKGERAVSSTRAAPGSPRVAASKSIAVLPFVNLSRDPDNEYFSDGMTEELINALTKIPGLRVAARTSSFAFKGKALDARTIGESLSVANLVEGSIRAVGDRLRVSAQLVNVRDGYHVWSEEYDRQTADVFAVQDEISRAIAGALRVRLAGGPDSALVRRPTADFEAYELYLKGRHEWQTRTRDGLQRAVAYFGQAIARDSTFARAWAGLADSYLNLADYRFVPGADAVRHAEAAARRAIALDPTLAEAYVSLGGVLDGRHDWRGAEDAYRQAIALDSNYATAHQWLGDFLAKFPARRREAVEEVRRARALDPLSLPVNNDLGNLLALAGDYEDAVRQLQTTIALEPRFPWAHENLALVYARMLRFQDAIRELRTADSLVPGDPEVLGWLTAVYARTGRRAEAEQTLRELRATPDGEARSLSLGFTYALLGEPDSAFRWLDRVHWDARSELMQPDNPVFDALHSDPRFPALLRRMGYPP